MSVKWLGFFVAAAFAFCAGGARAQTRINAAYGTTSILNAPIWVAKDRGYFAKYGLDVELIQITGTRITTALTSDSVQFISSAASSPFLANIAGGNALLVAVTVAKVPYDLVVDSAKIKSFADFKGKRGGVVTRGDISEVILSHVLRNHGIDPEKDVAILQGLGSDAERFGAIVSGSIDFTLTQPDFRDLYGAAHLTTFLSVVNEPGSDFIMSGAFTNAQFAKAHPDAVEAYVKAIAEALTFVRSNGDGTMAIVAKYSQRQPADLKTGYEIYKDLMQKKPVVSRDLVVSSLDTLKYSSDAAAKADPDKLFDASFAAKLDAEGFFDKEIKEGGK